jgi:ubiquinone/menaquinone biosynthesis C-methylase UbiE
MIVDVGCGAGDLAVAISKKVRESRIVGVDASPSMLLYASRHETTDGRLRFIVGDGSNMPFADQSVDLVVSTLSLHHWADPAGVMAEIDRVLRAGGKAFIYDLGLLTLTPQEMAKVVADAGIPSESVGFEKVRGGLLSRLFVLFRYDVER